MAKYKTGPFFGALVAIDKIVLPGIEKVRALGITVDMPDMAAIKSGGQQRLDAVCNAATVAEADAKIRELDAWGQNEATTKLETLRTTVETEIAKKSADFQKLIQSEVDMESELKTYAQSLADAKKTELENADPETVNMGAVQAEVRAQVEAKAATYVADLKKKIQDKIDQIMAGKKEDFQAAADYFKNISAKINDEIKAQLPAYDQYKTAAFMARKDLILKIVDKNIADGITQLQAAKAEIDEAKKDNPDIESVDQLIADLQADRGALAAKLETAAAVGEENGLQNPLIDFRTKWEQIRKDMADKMASTVSLICSKALPQFSDGKNQIDQNLSKLVDLNNKCATDNTDQCLKIREFASRFDTIINKLTGLKTEMNMVENSCKTPDKVDRQTLLDLLKKIKADGQDAKTFGEALAAEKDKAIAESLAQVCGQALPQIEAAKTEMANNDVPALLTRIKECKVTNPDQDKCAQFSLYQSEYNTFADQYGVFIASVSNSESLCKNANNEAQFEALRASLNDTKLTGQNLQETAKLLRSYMAEKDSEKIYCRIAMSAISNAERPLSDGLKELRRYKDVCKNRTDGDCPKINNLAPKIADIETRTDTALKNYYDINKICNNNINLNKPSQALLDAVTSLKNKKTKLAQDAADLVASIEEIGFGVLIQGESAREDERKGRKEIVASWRPAYYGGGDFLMSAPGDYAMYDTDLAVSGTYNIWVRDLAGTVNAGKRSFSLNLSGRAMGPFTENSAGQSATYPPGAFYWHKVGQMQMDKGQWHIKISKTGNPGADVIIDAIFLTTTDQVPPEK
ncbi:MAG: hypothetical protein NTX82_00195 [Candidatus Parcubacteria bacterium]|nr:hypothetical protein [Candidatus Parcubacteria bacterium]